MRVFAELGLLGLLTMAGCAPAGAHPEPVEVTGADGRPLAGIEATPRLLSVSTEVPFGEAPPLVVSSKASSESKTHVVQTITTGRHRPPPPAPRSRTPVLVGALAYLGLAAALGLLAWRGEGRRRARARLGLGAWLAAPVALVGVAAILAPPRLVIDNASAEPLTVKLDATELEIPARHFVELPFTEPASRLEVRQAGALRESAALVRARSFFVKPTYIYNCLGANGYRVQEARYQR